MSEINQISNLKSKISKSLKNAIRDISGLEIEPELIVQTDLSKGDYSSSVAMMVFGSIKNNVSSIKYKNAMELAEEAIRILNTKYLIPNTFRLVEAKPPGFINFWLSREAISRQVAEVLRTSEKVDRAAKSKLIFEFGDPNPFKEPHIGHLRNLVLGEAIVRLIESGGTGVVRANYQGDVGLHVAKALWGIKNHEERIMNLLDEGTLEDKAKLLGKAYSFGAEKFESDEEAKKEIISINKKIYQKISNLKSQISNIDAEGAELLDVWQKGRELSLDYFEELYKKLDIKYDKYYFESQTAPLGVKIVEENSPEVFEKHDGALIFRGEEQGLHTRVFVTKEGYATYEGKDLALAVLKDTDFPDIDRSIIMTANEQSEYFKVLLSALKYVNPKIAGKTSHLSFGFVNLKEGKMSSRSGNVVSAFWLLDEVKKRLKNGFKEVSDDVLNGLSVGAVKWSMLKFSRESDISFSIDESIDLAGNSGPYMQYAYARICSLLEKSGKANFEANSVKSLNGELLALARVICQFENQIKTAEETFSPNILTTYLFSLAQKFNTYYEKEKIIGGEKEEEKLFIVKAVGQVLKKGLYLLGISAPEKI